MEHALHPAFFPLISSGSDQSSNVINHPLQKPSSTTLYPAPFPPSKVIPPNLTKLQITKPLECLRKPFQRAYACLRVSHIRDLIAFSPLALPAALDSSSSRHRGECSSTYDESEVVVCGVPSQRLTGVPGGARFHSSKICLCQ